MKIFWANYFRNIFAGYKNYGSYESKKSLFPRTLGLQNDFRLAQSNSQGVICIVICPGWGGGAKGIPSTKPLLLRHYYPLLAYIKRWWHYRFTWCSGGGVVLRDIIWNWCAQVTASGSTPTPWSGPFRDHGLRPWSQSPSEHRKP